MRKDPWESLIKDGMRPQHAFRPNTTQEKKQDKTLVIPVSIPSSRNRIKLINKNNKYIIKNNKQYFSEGQ